MAITFDSITFTETLAANNALTISDNIIIKRHNKTRVDVVVSRDTIATTDGDYWDGDNILHMSYGANRETIYGTTNGNKCTFTITLENIHETTFSFSISEHMSDGIIVRSYGKTAQPIYIDYEDLVILCQLGEVTTAGRMTVSFYGLYWNGNFGSTSNSLDVDYRWRIAGQTWSSWLTAGTGYSINGNFTITGLDYAGPAYEVELRATDKIQTVYASGSQVGTPLFDWSPSDFRFGVPVHADDYIKTKNEKGYHQDNYSGESIELLNLKSDNNLHIGFGGYAAEQGATMIYGNDIQAITNKGLYVNELNLLGLARAMSNSYELTATPSNKFLDGTVMSNLLFTDLSSYAVLRGNCLYVRHYCKNVPDFTATGDINDVFVGSVTIKHGGKIKDMEYVTAVAGSSGTTCGLEIKNITFDETWDEVSFEVYICNAAAVTNRVLGVFVIPVTLNLDAFTE